MHQVINTLFRESVMLDYVDYQIFISYHALKAHLGWKVLWRRCTAALLAQTRTHQWHRWYRSHQQSCLQCLDKPLVHYDTAITANSTIKQSSVDILLSYQFWEVFFFKHRQNNEMECVWGKVPLSFIFFLQISTTRVLGTLFPNFSPSYIPPPPPPTSSRPEKRSGIIMDGV